MKDATGIDQTTTPVTTEDSCSEGTFFNVPYERVAMAFRGSSPEGGPRMLAICAEPGMGLHDVITGILSEQVRMGAVVTRREMRSMTPDEAARLVGRISREVAKQGGARVVAFDNIPPSDEACVLRQARAIRRMISEGVPVVFSIAPEARQLLEELPEAVVISSNDLVVQGLTEAGRLTSSREVRELTRGIPSLVRSLGGSSSFDGTAHNVPRTYYDALANLVNNSLRITLSDEELRLRLSMLLLGSGSRAELASLIGAVSAESFDSLNSNAPLFGVSPNLESFDCLLSDSPLALSSCLPRMTALCSLFPDLLDGALEIMARHGNYVRSAAVLKMLRRGEGERLVLDNGPQFLDVGEVVLVKRVVQSSFARSRADAMDLSALELAIAALGRRRFSRRAIESPELLTRSGVEALMLAETRLVLRAEIPMLPREGREVSDLARRLAIHRDACALLTDGHFSSSLRLLISTGEERRSPTLSTALLDLDLELSRVLVGDGTEGDEGRLEESAEFLSQPALEGLHAYPVIVKLVRAAVEGRPHSPSEADMLAGRAERSGDVLIQILALCVGVVCDLRGRSYARANVKALLAVSVAKRAGLVYLSRVASLLGDVARFLLGERAGLTIEGRSDDLGAVASLAYEAMTGEGDAACLGGLPAAVPRDALWLLRIFSEGVGEFSELFRERMPQGWRRALVSVTGASILREEPVVERPSFLPAAIELFSAEPEGQAPLGVTLLGGFAVYVRGVRIPDWKLEHRNAKSMLEFLVLQHGGSAKRYHLVEQVWPDCDYIAGFNRAYQATTVIRTAVAEIEAGLDPFVTSRTSREVCLDMGMVRCDVDLFRALAREASDSADEARALSLARQVERIYVGDLYVPPLDCTGYIAAVRAELKELYADAMVAGADAALRLGQERTAARLASNALMANDLREDAVIVLVRALQASGRGVEADEQYESYSNRLLRVGNRRPSSRLRKVMGEIRRSLPPGRRGEDRPKGQQ